MSGVQTTTSYENIPFYRDGEPMISGNEVVAQDTGRGSTALADKTVMYQDPSTKQWYPLTSVTPTVFGSMLCGANGAAAVATVYASMVTGANGTDLAGMQAVTDGSFTIVVDGFTIVVAGLDFSEITALDELADTINAVALGRFTAIYDSDNTTLTFITPTGTDKGSVSVLTAGGGGTDISGSGFLNGLTGTGTPTAGSGGLSALKAVTDGEFSITVDGVVIDITGLDFSVIDHFSDISEIINAVALGRFTAIHDSATNATTFVSPTRGAEGSVSVLSAVSGGSGTDVSGAGFLNGLTGTGTATAGSGGQFPVGVIREALTGAQMVAGTVTGVNMLIGGVGLIIDEGQLVYENSLDTDSVVDSKGKTIEACLRELGIYSLATIDISS